MFYIFLFIIAIAAFGIADLVYKKRFNEFLHMFILQSFNALFSTTIKKFNFRKMADEDFWLKRIKKNPNNANHYKKLGEWYAENNNKEYAIQTLEYAVKLNPSNKKLITAIEKLREEA